MDNLSLPSYRDSRMEGGANMNLGDKLKLLRTQKGLTQEAFAEVLQVSRSAVAKWESNNGIPEISNLKQISQVLNISLDESNRLVKMTYEQEGHVFDCIITYGDTVVELPIVE